MRHLRVGILQGLLGNPNMGCNALLYSAVKLLNEAAQDLDLALDVTCFSRINPEDVKMYPALKGCSIRTAPLMTLRQRLSDRLRNSGVRHKILQESFNSCAAFFEIAGGDSFSDIYGIQRLKDANHAHRRIIRLCRPLIFLPQTIGPFSTDEARAIASNSLRDARFVFTRDPMSYREAETHLGTAKVQNSIDMAFFMDYEPRPPIQRTALRLGLNPSGLLWNGGYSGANQFGLLDEYPHTLRTILGMLLQLNFVPVLVPHVLSGPGFKVEDDYRVCKQLQLEFPGCEVAPYFYTPMEAKGFISQLDLLIGSRMHACIAAYSTGVPVYPLAYSPKFSSLFSGALGWPHGADLRRMTRDQIIADLREFIGQFTKLKAAMPIRVDALQTFKQPLIAGLRSLLQEAYSA